MQTSDPAMLVATVSYLVWLLLCLHEYEYKARVSGAPRKTVGAKTMDGSCLALPCLSVCLDGSVVRWEFGDAADLGTSGEEMAWAVGWND